MSEFGVFYLDKEKDVIVTLNKEGGKLFYVLSTPNHGTGNLITNLANVCDVNISYDEEGKKVIRGEVPSYFDGDNNLIYILRLGNVKVANIYPDGTIERKAYIPAIAKTLMSQSKDYTLDINKAIVKTYIREEVKFRTDLHTHRSANLSPDLLIALGIHHQISYPLYYVKKLELRLSQSQQKAVEKRRAKAAKEFLNSGLEGKYLDRRIDDNTEINFADLILNNLSDSDYNIRKIRASLAVMKDGQAVFTNLEKVYLYRYVFTKGVKAGYEIKLDRIEKIPDRDIVDALKQMAEDRLNPNYKNNSLYQDKLLWTARSYQSKGIVYAEISDTALVKKSEAAATLNEIHEVMPAITKETGVTLRFLAALRRIPLTIIKDRVARNYFTENLQVLKAVAIDPYVAGSDFVGEEINDVRELKPVIGAVVSIAKDIPSYVVRIHAGENDSLPDNVLNSILTVDEARAESQNFPHMRIGHGLYTANLNTKKGQELLRLIKENKVDLEFQITSNVRLNNLSSLDNHPLKQYLEAGIYCVQGTDGGALYGTDSIDEQLSLERMLELDFEDMKKMKASEDVILETSMAEFIQKVEDYKKLKGKTSVVDFYNKRIEDEADSFLELPSDGADRAFDSKEVFANQIQELPSGLIPIVLAGGSFNNATRKTSIKNEVLEFIDDMITKADPKKVFFVIGPTLTAYEKYLYEKAKDRFEVFAFVPAEVTEREYKKLKKSKVKIRVAIESSMMGTYKSFAYEIFKRRRSIVVVLDGNSPAANLIQDAKNSKYESRIFIDSRSKALKNKAETLAGYITYLEEDDNADEILGYAAKYKRLENRK